MIDKRLHIISFDVPLPADYGGVIDVFNKIRHLHRLGVQIILHCYKYGRSENLTLKNYCKEVHYYPRSTSKKKLFSQEPFIVATRKNPLLLQRLLVDNHPILFEGLHSTALLTHPLLQQRIKVVRSHNIEHEYYHFLSQAEKSIFRKMYLLSESLKLKSYEKVLKHAQHIGAISINDQHYFNKNYGHTFLLPPFHHYDEIKSKLGEGNYSLYHGNLKVAENEKAALWLVEHISPQLTHPLIIAGSYCSGLLRKKIKQTTNVSLVETPSEEILEKLIADAHLHLLPSFQSSGIKLKLLHALYCGRFVLANTPMLNGTSLNETCLFADNIKDFIQIANTTFNSTFTTEEIEKRKKSLSFHYNNASNGEKLLDQIFNNQ